MNKKNLKLLNDFANNDVLATHIKVSITDMNKSFTPRCPTSIALYNDANLLASVITGAERFLWWLERAGYKVTK